MEKIKEKLEKIQEIVREGFPSYPLMTGEAVWQLATEALALIDEMEKEEKAMKGFMEKQEDLAPEFAKVKNQPPDLTAGEFNRGE